MTKLELLQERRRMYLQAEHDILRSGQVVTIEGMTLTRVDIDAVRAMINDLDNEIASELRAIHKRQRSRVRVVVPI